jgi:ubiquinone/menaquinone biosynthesis C-methylase UbiE
MTTAHDAKIKAASTYNAAADFYDDPANSFWERFSRRTVERLGIAPGARVLDVCCGSGASALSAVEKVGPEGFVLGVDLAQKLLALAQTKVRDRNLRNIEFRMGDLLNLGVPDANFEVVICVFGIFFVPDMHAAVRELCRAARPGGKLAITTWGPNFFEPATTAFWNSVRDVRPDLFKGFNPWDRISDPESLRALLQSEGIEHLDVVAESGTHAIPTPESWWSAVLGSGYRGTVDELDLDARERVRTANLDFIRNSDVREVEANVVYAVGTKASFAAA